MAEFVQSEMKVIEIEEPVELMYPTETLERFWAELSDIPVNNNGIIQESFLWWPKGVNREDIWRWFDEKYPGGVAKLIGVETQNVIDKLCEIGNPGYILTREEIENFATFDHGKDNQ